MVALFVESMSAIAYTSNDEIHLSADYVVNYEADIKNEIMGSIGDFDSA